MSLEKCKKCVGYTWSLHNRKHNCKRFEYRLLKAWGNETSESEREWQTRFYDGSDPEELARLMVEEDYWSDPCDPSNVDHEIEIKDKGRFHVTAEAIVDFCCTQLEEAE